MTKADAIDAVRNGKLVECSAAEYPEIRTALHEQVGKWVDWGDTVRAQIGLSEIKRLDMKYPNR